MARLSTWALGAAVSGAVHLGFGAALLAALVPQDVPDQPRAKSSLQVTPEVVTRSDAKQQTPQSADIAEEDATGAALGAGSVATANAIPQALSQPKVTAQDTPQAPISSTIDAPSVIPQNTPTQSADPVAPKTESQTGRLPDAATSAAQNPVAQSTTNLQPLSNQVVSTAPVAAPVSIAARPPTTISKPVTPNTNRTADQEVTSTSLTVADLPAATPTSAVSPPAPLAVAALPQTATPAAAAPPSTQTLSQDTPKSERTASVAPYSNEISTAEPAFDTVGNQPPTPAAVVAAAPKMTATKAVLAFPNAGTGDVDPASLAAFQSFTQPQAGDAVRDNLEAALSLPCARMQVSFDPETTTLQVSGHVPQDSQRAPVLAALRAQMGNDIAVRDNLLVLPAPQCGALSGIAAVGLPQSTDQITNPLIVGTDTHARSFRYIKDDPLVLDLTAPDYPAYVYVDYFDADGNVIHLSPNERTPLRATTPKQQLQIGARTPTDDGLYVIIGPPYGQEIAVAFAASQPLYDAQRPLIEPADDYLRWLQQRVAQIRDETPDFKGEWVYFFVQTAAQ